MIKQKAYSTKIPLSSTSPRPKTARLTRMPERAEQIASQARGTWGWLAVGNGPPPHSGFPGPSFQLLSHGAHARQAQRQMRGLTRWQKTCHSRILKDSDRSKAKLCLTGTAAIWETPPSESVIKGSNTSAQGGSGQAPSQKCTQGNTAAGSQTLCLPSWTWKDFLAKKTHQWKKHQLCN